MIEEDPPHQCKPLASTHMLIHVHTCMCSYTCEYTDEHVYIYHTQNNNNRTQPKMQSTQSSFYFPVSSPNGFPHSLDLFSREL